MSRMDQRHRAALLSAVTVGAAFGMVSVAQAEDITVTSLADDGSPGTLRSAIEIANASISTEDRILFQSGLSGQISLAEDLPVLEGPVEIDGPGSGQLAIDGGGHYTMFTTFYDFSLSGLTLERGHNSSSGGAIRAPASDVVVDGVKFDRNSSDAQAGAIAGMGGSLIIKDSEFTGNTSVTGAGGFFAYDEPVTIANTKFVDNETGADSSGGGGYIHGEGVSAVTITDTEFSGNSAGQGGGLNVMTPGKTTIDSSLFAGNTASGSVGALAVLSDAPVTLSNSTISGNTAQFGAGGFLGGGTNLKIESSTISGNETFQPAATEGSGGGIVQLGGSTNVHNSIVSGNEPADISTSTGSSVQGSFNLIGDKSGADFIETVPGSNIASTDPRLGPLADNGGPLRTMLPDETSPAVNKGSSALTVDQRGLTRPVDFVGVPFSTAAGANGADIGAVELQYTAPPPPPPPPPTPPSNKFTFGKVKLNKKKGVATLQVKVPGAGRVQLLGSRSVKPQRKTAKGKSMIRLTVKAKGKANKGLKKRGKAKVKAKVKFTPTGGTAKTKSKRLKLVKKRAKRRK